MLVLVVPGVEVFNEETNKFSTVGDVTIELEHSLVAVSKWESIYLKPFLGKQQRTPEETKAYIRAMIISDSPPEDIVDKLTQDNMKAIHAYIESPATATTFGDMPEANRRRGETITSELIYYWMVLFQIPFECERWHLNRLFSLVRICNVKSGKQKKLSKQEIVSRNRALNAKRKAELGTNG